MPSAGLVIYNSSQISAFVLCVTLVYGQVHGVGRSLGRAVGWSDGRAGGRSVGQSVGRSVVSLGQLINVIQIENCQTAGRLWQSSKKIPVFSVVIFSFCLIPEKRRSARFRRRSFSSRELKDLNDGKEIYETLTQASDPDSVKVSVPVKRFWFYL